MVVNGVSVVVFERENISTEYRIGGYYTFPCMHNNELMRCEKIFFLNDMMIIVFDAFTTIGYQRFILKPSDTEHMFRIMDKATFLKQPDNIIFNITNYECFSMIGPFYLKGNTIGNSSDFYFNEIHTELYITDFTSPIKRNRQSTACSLPFVVGSPQKASQTFKIDKGTVFIVFETDYYTRLVMRERKWIVSKERERNAPTPSSSA
jgi:hypothetical protein